MVLLWKSISLGKAIEDAAASASCDSAGTSSVAPFAAPIENVGSDGAVPAAASAECWTADVDRPEMIACMTSAAALDALVRDHLDPGLRQLGFRRAGRTWWRGEPSSGWVLTALARWRYNDASRVQFSIETVVWPVGTWETEVAFSPAAARRSRPEVLQSAPLSAGPRELLPERYGDRDWPWTIQRQPTEGLVEEVMHYCTEQAVPIAENQLDIDIALQSLTEQPRRWSYLAPVWSLVYACGMLEHGAPDHARFRETVVTLRDAWMADPRPDFLRPKLQEWCRMTDVGLEHVA